jgi:hemolysin activation/secretion protein
MPAYAQTIPGAANVTRLQNDLENRNNPPQTSESPAPLARPQNAPPSEAVPANAETITFTLRGIDLKGVSVYRPRELEGLWRSDVGKTVSLKRVYDIAAAITARYRADGYFLASAYIPAQEIGNGTVRIAVVEGYIGQVKFDGDMPSSHVFDSLKSRLLSLGPLNVKALERQMLLLNDLPGTRFRAILKPLDDEAGQTQPLAPSPAAATTPETVAPPSTQTAPEIPPAARAPPVEPPVKEGGVLLEIVGEPQSPVHGSVSVDNTGSRYLGPYLASAQMSIDRGLPDLQQAVITLNSSVPDHELKSVLGKYIIPLNDNGVKLSLNAGYSQGRPGYTLTPDDLVADSTTLGTELEWDAVRQRTENLRLLVGLDYLDSRTSLLNLPFVDDRISAARLGIHYDEQDRLEGSVIADATLKRGLPILGASHPGDLNLSRAEGKPDGTSLASTVYRSQAISASWNALFGATGQIASAPLLSSQQFGYGGQSFGRAYDSSELVGDQGIAATAELRYDGLSLPDGFHLQPFAFYDIGRVWNLAAGLPARASGASGGLGFRLSMPRGIALSLTAAKPLTRAADTPQYGDGKEPRVIFSLSDSF